MSARKMSSQRPGRDAMLRGDGAVSVERDRRKVVVGLVLVGLVPACGFLRPPVRLVDVLAVESIHPGGLPDAGRRPRGAAFRPRPERAAGRVVAAAGV